MRYLSSMRQRPVQRFAYGGEVQSQAPSLLRNLHGSPGLGSGGLMTGGYGKRPLPPQFLGPPIQAGGGGFPSEWNNRPSPMPFPSPTSIPTDTHNTVQLPGGQPVPFGGQWGGPGSGNPPGLTGGGNQPWGGPMSGNPPNWPQPQPIPVPPIPQQRFAYGGVVKKKKKMKKKAY